MRRGGDVKRTRFTTPQLFNVIPEPTQKIHVKAAINTANGGHCGSNTCDTYIQGSASGCG